MTEINRSVSEVLHTLGVPAHVKGYDYISSAVNLVIESPMRLSVTKEIYPRVAAQFHDKPQNIERCMRSAIETVWDRGDIDVLYDFFGDNNVNCDRGKTTNAEFIYLIAHSIKRKSPIQTPPTKVKFV